MTSTPTRPVDNVVITTKGLQDRNIQILDGTTVENKGKLILNNRSSFQNDNDSFNWRSSYSPNLTGRSKTFYRGKKARRNVNTLLKLLNMGEYSNRNSFKNGESLRLIFQLSYRRHSCKKIDLFSLLE